VAKRFEGKLVLVTGGAAGLGRSIALGFAREGANLILADIDEAGLKESAAEAAKLGAKCATHRVDMSSEAEIQAFAAKVCAEHKRLDVLINNAGIAYGKAIYQFAELTLAQWQLFLTVNTVAPLLLAQAVRAPLAAAKGVVINQTSIGSFSPGSAYGVTKAALNAMTYGMAHAFGGDGIRVNAVAPGMMETPASKANLTPETYARSQARQILKLHGTSEDITNLHLFLASDDARFITCEVVSCDAGNGLRGWRG
jgi:3-oxoacyl-[acyl-carrier protein] reductase